MFRVFLTLLLPILISVPIAYGEIEATKIDNKTFLINVEENYSINIPPTNVSGIEKIVNAVENGHSKWGEGDVLFTSGTIFAFFSLGSFLVDRMEGRNKPQQMKVIQVILGFTGGIQTIHLIIIIIIVTGHFDPNFYAEMIGLTIIALWVILAGVHETYSLNSKEKDERDQFNTDAYRKMEVAFDQIRDEKKKKKEEGE